MSKEQSIAAALQGIVDAGRLAGMATLAWRMDGAAETTCVGWRDLEAGQPIQRDTLFRIASMTKPITSTAALMLLEEGCFALGDPITRWVPEFSSMRVLRSPTAALDDTVPAARPITFEDLLTHRSGLTYGAFHPHLLQQAFEKLGGSIDTLVAPDEWLARLATLPLIDQPGAGFHYGHSTDLLGLIIARVAQATLGELLLHKIFAPLGMHDTGFRVPTVHHHRRAAAYGFDATGRLTRRIAFGGGAVAAERLEDMSYESGGAGLWSTLDDYLAFARMFVGQGAVDGVRLLQPQTLALMTANHLTTEQRAKARVLGNPLFAAGHSFGLGVAVVQEPEQADRLICGGGRGAVGWPGAYGGWWQADPNDGSVLIFLTHNMVELDEYMRGLGFGAYEAIARFQALASARA